MQWRSRPTFLVSDRSCPKTDGLRPHHWTVELGDRPYDGLAGGWLKRNTLPLCIQNGFLGASSLSAFVNSSTRHCQSETGQRGHGDR